MKKFLAVTAISTALGTLAYKYEQAKRRKSAVKLAFSGATR